MQIVNADAESPTYTSSATINQVELAKKKKIAASQLNRQMFN